MAKKTFKIDEKDGERFIECLVCGMKSYSRLDIDNEFCAECNQFHNIMGYQIARAIEEKENE